FGDLVETPEQESTMICWPWKCKPVAWSTTFQFPPSAALGLQPGYTTPPKLKSPTPWATLPICPPPVSQHGPGGGGVSQNGPPRTNSTTGGAGSTTFSFVQFF